MLVLRGNISYVCDIYNIPHKMRFKGPEANF